MLLAIYLNDHLAGATAGRELGRRAATSNRDSSHGPFLADLADQIDADRGSLLEIMRTLNVRVDRIKVLGGWGAEKLARLKFNGQLRGYSPLSRLVELEALSLGVRGKLALWRTLRELDLSELSAAPVSLADLIARAEQQLAGLESIASRRSHRRSREVDGDAAGRLADLIGHRSGRRRRAPTACRRCPHS